MRRSLLLLPVLAMGCEPQLGATDSALSFATISDLGELGAPENDSTATWINASGDVACAGGTSADRWRTNAVVWEVSVSDTAEDAVDALDDIIDDLVDSGALSSGNANALSSKLDAIQRQIERGNCTAAANQRQRLVRARDLGLPPVLGSVRHVPPKERAPQLHRSQRRHRARPSSATAHGLRRRHRRANRRAVSTFARTYGR